MNDHEAYELLKNKHRKVQAIYLEVEQHNVMIQSLSKRAQELVGEMKEALEIINHPSQKK